MKTIYFQKLDTLRFIAFFLVFWQHAFIDFFNQISFVNAKYIDIITSTGIIGVDIFFVVSGFLITFLLVKEFEKYGSVNLKNFYIRRILRIWSLYYFVLLMGIFILPLIFSGFHFSGDIFKNLFFLNNFDWESPNIPKNVLIAWSVAIEEQFYLAWPLLFIFLIKKVKLLLLACLIIFLGSSCFVLMVKGNLAYFHTFGNLNYLMIGCVGGILYSKSTDLIANSFLMKKRYLFIVLILLLLLFTYDFDSIIFVGIAPFLFLFLTFYCIVNDYKNERKHLFSTLGKYTYGMYLYHPMIIIFVKIIFDCCSLSYQNSAVISGLVGVISFFFTIGISFLSYELFEKKILKYKTHFSLIGTRM